jgi:hypothetical protein
MGPWDSTNRGDMFPNRDAVVQERRSMARPSPVPCLRIGPLR